MDENLYSKKLEEQYSEYEALCKRCGTCCGLADGDPCRNLVLVGNGSCTCSVYTNRLKVQKTVSGKSFSCVSVRELLNAYDLPHPACGYAIKNPPPKW